MKVNLENNKYTLTFDEVNGSLVANRNGEYWMDYSGNKFVYLMLARIVELESVLKEYANPDNWGQCDDCTPSRMWREPDSYTPEAYNGFELAQKVLSTDKQ